MPWEEGTPVRPQISVARKEDCEVCSAEDPRFQTTDCRGCHLEVPNYQPDLRLLVLLLTQDPCFMRSQDLAQFNEHAAHPSTLGPDG